MHPLTNVVPKALLNVGGKTLVDWTIERLKRSGIRKIIVAVGWMGSMVEDHLKRTSNTDTCVVYVADYEIGPLQTLTATLETFDDDFLLTPVDLLIDQSVVSGMLTQYSTSDKPHNMTLAVDFDTDVGTIVSTSKDNLITGLGNEVTETSQTGHSAMLFIGNSRLAKNCREAIDAGETKFVALLNQLIHEGELLEYYSIDNHGLDIDSLYDLLSANRQILQRGELYHSGHVFVPEGDSIEIGDTLQLGSKIVLQKETELIGPILISSGCNIGEKCRIGPSSTIGSNSSLFTGCEISDSIVFGESTVAAHSRLKSKIVYKSEQYDVEQ